MSLSQLASNCQACPYKDTCDHKRMEAVGFLQPLQNEQLMPMQESLIVPHNYRQVKIAPGVEVTIDLENFREEIKKSIAKHAGLYGGFFNNCS